MRFYAGCLPDITLLRLSVFGKRIQKLVASFRGWVFFVTIPSQ
jgi:hypothetical protein